MQVLNHDAVNQTHQCLEQETNTHLVEAVTYSDQPKKIKLLYRALIFERSLLPEPSYRQPRAINWRFQIPGKITILLLCLNPYLYVPTLKAVLSTGDFNLVIRLKRRGINAFDPTIAY